MAKTLIVNYGNAALSVAASTTNYPFGPGTGVLDTSVTEANAQMTWRTAGTCSNLYIRVTSNNVGASTLRTRLNTANGSQSVSIGASGTGEFEDATNSDSIMAGDELGCQLVTGTGGTSFQADVLSVLFSATTNTVYKTLTSTMFSLSAASTTHYRQLSGGTTETTSETNVQHQISTGGTFKNQYLYISANGRTTNTTFTVIVNGTPGNVTITVAGSTTGVFEDITNSDSITANDLCNFRLVTGTGIGTITMQVWGVDFETTTDKFVWGGGRASGNVLNANTITWGGVGRGTMTEVTTESFTSVDANIACDVTNLWCYISANTVTATSTLRLKVNQANGNLVASIGASTTGEFEDTTNTDSLVATDEVNIEVDTGNTGTSLTIRGHTILVTNTETAQIYSNLLLMGIG